MSINHKWEYPKDPSDKAWYGITFPFDIDRVVGVTIMLTGPMDFHRVGEWRTPGDVITNAQDVTAIGVQIDPDNRTVMMKLIDGKPMHEYAVQAHVVDHDGNEISRSRILEVHGQ